MERPNILLLFCDQLRFDAIAANGNRQVRTPNIDRLAARGVTFTNAYSTCPVCIPARYTLRTGREPFHTGCYQNELPAPMDGLPPGMEERCGPYLARTMDGLGYRTFGIGKFHTHPEAYEDLGYEVKVQTEEIWGSVADKERDDYIRFLGAEYPAFGHIEQPHGERTDMYYMPQTSPLPAEATVEAYVAGRAVEQIQVEDNRPWFGFVSFIGPHPPFAPPVPFNRMYNPDDMQSPVEGALENDHADEQITFMNRLIWADEISHSQARALKARYYGEITYIDGCIGRILDEVERRPDADNTVILLAADHGDHLGDHHAWQKESYFEQACRIPLLVSWPGRVKPGGVCAALACLTDLFGTVTAAAGRCDPRDGMNLLSVLDGGAPRESLYACYGRPGTPQFKCMLRRGPWKYIYLANGGREQLFHLGNDPMELSPLSGTQPELAASLRAEAEAFSKRPGLYAALDGDRFRAFPFTHRPFSRIHQFDITVPGNNFTL